MRDMILFVLFALLNIAFAMPSFSIQSAVSSPAFFWGNNAKVPNFLPQNIIEGSDVFKSLVDPNQELTIIFAESNLQSNQIPQLSDAYSSQPDGGIFKNIKTLLNNAPNSLILPYIIQTTDALEKLTAQPGVQTFSSKNGASIQKAINSLKNNGKQDFVVITLEAGSIQSDNEVVSQIVSQLGNSAYSCLYLGITEQEREQTHTAPSHLQSHMSHKTQQYMQNNDGNTFITPNILTGLLLAGIPIILILWVGISCTFGLQSALKFDAEKDMMKKMK